MTIATGQFTIVDLNDFESGVTPPIEPNDNSVWLDTSVNPPVFKIWNGNEWVVENDWNEKVNGLEDSINETKSNLEGTQTEVRLLKNSVDLKADTSYVDRVKTELTLGGKNKMPFTLFAMENFTSYWTTSHNDIATMSLVDYNFGVEGNDDYFIAGKKVLNFSVNSIKATEQQINYSTCNVIDDKKFIKLKPNKDYTFSSWILKNNFCEKFKFVVFNKATNKIHATSSLFSAESDKFKRYALTFTTDSTEEYCVIIYNYPKSGASGNSNVYLYNMIVEEGEASDVWSPCIDDVGSSSIAYIEESLKQLKSNLKVEDDKITASVSKIKENTETINGEVQKNKKWIENAQLAIDSGSIVGTVSNYLPGADNLMPYTYMNIKDIEKSWSVSPKGTITKRIYDFGAVSSQDNFLYGKNVLMISCTPLDASSIEDSLLTLTVAPEKRDIALEVNTKYTISYYLYITDRIKSVKCQIWNKAKNTSLNSTIEEDSIVTEYTEHFVKVEVPFTTTVDDTVYYPKFIIEMKKDLLRDANIYLADMMIQKGSVNITWMPNKEDSEKYVDATMTEKMVEVNEKFLEYGKELKNLDTYMKGAFKDGIIDSTEAENIRESLRYLDIEKRAIDAQYNEIMSNTSLVDNENVLTNKNNIEDEVSTYGAGPTVSDVTVIEAFRNGRFKLRYKVGNELPNEETTHFISKNGANYESVDAIKYGDYYEAIGTGLAPGDNKVSIKVINSAGQNIFSNITVTIKENSKAHLTFSKGEYNTKYNELVALINRVLEAGKVTEQDKNDIDSAFNAYGEKLSQFHAAFNSAIDAIAESKVSALTQQLDTKMAQFKVTVDGISSTVKKTETITGEILGDLSNINGSIGDLTTSVGVAKENAQKAQDAADSAKGAADTANRLVSDISNDNRFTPSEKQSAKLEWDVIVGEKSGIIESANKYSVSTTDYLAKYDALSSYITPLLSNLTDTSDINGGIFRNKFKDYYNSKQAILNNISSEAKSLVDVAERLANDAQGTADSAIKAAQTAQSTAETAKSSAQTANNKLGEIASDSKLTPSEKQNTKLEWDKIVGEKDKIISEATKFEVSTTTYTNNYNTLNSYITPLLSDLNSTSDIVGTTFRSNFANYYNARQDVLNLISSKAKALADNAQTAADNANKQVSALGSRVSTVEQKVEADNITNVVRQHTSYKNDLNAKANKTDVYTKSEIENKNYQSQSQVQQTINGLQVKVEDSGGYNLVKNSCGAGGDKGWYAPDDVTISVNRDLARLVTAGANTGLKIQHSSSSNVIVYSDRFPLKPNSKYIISAWCDCSNIDSALFMVAGSDTLYSNDTTESYTWYKRAPIVTPGADFTKIFLAFETTANAKSAYVRIQIGPRTSTSSVGMLSFTKLLVTEGELDFDWSAHPDEVYAGIVEIGKEGVTVRRDDTDGYTVLDNKSLSVVEKGATIASFGENSSIPELRSGTIYAEDIKSSNLINTQSAITLYVDMTNGSDENDGLSSSSPLKTIQEALDRLNKCLIEDSVIINVTGTGNQSIKAWGFIGSGELNIIFSQTARLYTNTFDFYCCTCFIRVNGNKDGTEGKNSAQIIQQDNGDLFYIMACTYVHVKSACIVGQKSGQAITSIYGSHVFVEQCEVDRFSTCFLAKSAGIISVKNCIGSDDTYVAGGNNGGIIFLEAWENNSIVPNYTSSMYMSSGAAQVHRAGLPEGKGVKKSGVIYPPTYVPPEPPAATQYTKSWTPTKIYSDETLNGWSDRAELIQGYYSGWGTGRWTGYIKFNDANIRDTISGATNLSGKLYLKRRSSSHGVYSGAILALYGSDGTAIDTSSKFDLGTGKWITLSAAVVGKIQSGAIKYFYVKYDSSTQNRYIKFESNVTLQLSYKK